jgi:excinuclease ABC subunit C
MQEAAEAMDFELAAVYRDRLRALTFIQGTQTVPPRGSGDADIFALACKGGTMCIQAFFIRGGQNWGHRSFFPRIPPTCRRRGAGELPHPILRGSAAAQAILLDRELPEAELLAEAFSSAPSAR